MLNFIYTYIQSLFKPTDIILKLNGSIFIFTKEGDIQIKTSRNYIINSKYIFQNCTEEEIKTILFEDILVKEEVVCME